MNVNIQIRKSKGGKLTVSLRELYDYLGHHSSNWSTWSKRNIVNNDFAIENVDYRGFVVTKSGNETTDYEVTINLAKKIAMMSRTEKGDQVREYFLECEKKAKGGMIPPAQLSKLDILKMAITSEEERLRLEEENKVLQPKAAFYDAVADSKDNLDMSAVAKLLDFPNMGRNNLFKFLKSQQILRENNEPYQRYMQYFHIIEQKFESKGETHINIKTLVTQKGVDFIRKKLEQYQITIEAMNKAS